ncbi:ribulose-phosphate 3-epimerase [Patescibacteria group bacterium]|nr:ribulose-phosphate 3-epimerase [Patescibacteria group bacterium]MBU0964187.1 ribulose-phosphate 3-epimerase [Patescibacteria group bacterium]
MANIVPALLTNNLELLKNQLAQLEELVEWVQIDIIDGQFAKNKTITIDQAIKAPTSLKIEFDLMVADPENYIDKCRQANAERIFFHIEATDKPKDLIEEIKAQGMEAGISINPDTPVEKIKPVISLVGRVLVMSVTPGWQGQAFIAETIERIKQIKKMAPNLPVAVDGGIKLDNAYQAAEAGAEYLSVGSALWEGGEIEKNLQKFRAEIENI